MPLTFKMRNFGDSIEAAKFLNGSVETCALGKEVSGGLAGGKAEVEGRTEALAAAAGGAVGTGGEAWGRPDRPPPNCGGW